MTPTQCRMARGALHWTRKKLADESGLALRTIVTFESGLTVRDSSTHRIRTVLEANGIRLTENGIELQVSACTGS